MTMMTIAKKDTSKKKGRWQAALLASLVLVGSVAVPQAADAATKSTTCSKWSTSSECAVWLVARTGLSFKITGDVSSTHSYTVQTASGKTLARGRLDTGRSTAVYLAGYQGPVKITVQNRWGVKETIKASY